MGPLSQLIGTGGPDLGPFFPERAKIFTLYGEAGSKCDNGYENNDGLCKYIGLTGPEFVEKLNEKRREFAKKEKIPNMRKLVWSDELAQEVSVAKDVPFHEEAYADWLYDGTYEQRFKDLMDDLPKILLAKELNDSDEHSSANTAFSYYPLHEKIGCNKMIWENETYCFLTPGVPFEFLDMHFQAHYLFLDSGEAGSKCDNGYENEDGLCKHIEPTTSTVPTTTVTTTTKKPTPKTPTASISFPN
ncbi:hypothetical protein B9Z55_007943 [Caenorhabditis nigoni]|uniref:SCP domain-containing protein n=1 Tax=Caenorhabditis nigoni TaxID=1611254 RepID=A0A2G5VC23_9PELO|nr:hypothetical protein B9Z55_007943 [Caenorhabditis nigoni]